MAAPKVAKALKIGGLIEKEVISFFVDVVRKTVAQRKSTGIVKKTAKGKNVAFNIYCYSPSGEKRNDFVDNILEALTKIPVTNENSQDQFEKDAEIKTEGKLLLTEKELEIHLVANLMILFLAGRKKISNFFS